MQSTFYGPTVRGIYFFISLSLFFLLFSIIIFAEHFPVNARFVA